MPHRKACQGSSSLEVMAALILFTLVAAGLAIALPMAYGRMNLWRDQTNLARVLEKQGESLRDLAFTDLDVGDSGWLSEGDIQYRSVTTVVKPGVDGSGRPTWSPQTALSGDGLSAVYYDNQDLTGTTVLRTDGTVNFNWGNGSPNFSIDDDTFSARWTGFIETINAGTYTFYVDADDGFRLWVNQQLLLDYWITPSNNEVAATITLDAHTIYPIRMEYYEINKKASAFLRWSGPSLSKAIIPQSNLYSSLAKMTVVTVANAEGSRTFNGRFLTFDDETADLTAPSLHLHVAQMSIVRYYSGGRWGARATVLVRDELNRNVGTARVTGTWSGIVTGSGSSTTTGTGAVTLSSARTRTHGTITFTVTNITKFGCIYDPTANAVTSASISGP